MGPAGGLHRALRPPGSGAVVALPVVQQVLVARRDDGAGDRCAGRTIDDRAFALGVTRCFFDLILLGLDVLALGVGHCRRHEEKHSGSQQRPQDVLHFDAPRSDTKRSPRSRLVTMKRGSAMILSDRTTGRRSMVKAAT